MVQILWAMCKVDCYQWWRYWHQILSVLIQNTNNSTFFTCTLGHVKKSGIVDALNLRRLRFDACTLKLSYKIILQ